ncbi:unnamed protein product [Diamesa tonsa]
MSDFSIDHILNRAGERFLKKHRNSEQYFETISSGSSSCGDETNSCDNYDERYFQAKFSDGERFMDLPSFDWLNYTRYNMPRLPRPTKGPVKRTPGRLPRIPFSPHQLNELEIAYKSASYLSTEDANILANKLELTGIRVKIWFQNRRARDRRERKDLMRNNKATQDDDNDEEIVVS